MRGVGFVPLALAILVVASPAVAAPAVDAEDYRLFCGYLDALEWPNVKALKKDKDREKVIAKKAKTTPKKLMEAVRRAEQVGSTCDEIGKKLEADAGEAVKRALPGRIDLWLLDFDDPAHVVAAVRWKGADKKQLEEEAALLALILAEEAPIVRTIAIRGVDPRAPDREADEAVWFEAKINKERALRIERDKIKDFADTRYIRLFDNIVRN